MENSRNHFENQLRIYTNLYFIIGLIESELRNRIVIALGDLASEKGYAEWTSVIPPTFKNLKSISVAFKKNREVWQDFERYLTFSFWRHLFDGSNYTALWIPALHTVFPSLEKPLSWRSFSQVTNHMARANHIRNRIAHYNFHSPSRYESDKEVLMWLLDKMEWNGAS